MQQQLKLTLGLPNWTFRLYATIIGQRDFLT